MKGVELPDLTEDFTADPVELFFDLAYVFAFTQLVGRLVHDPTWSGAAEAGILFLLLWLPWSQFTWAANAVSGNGRSVRSVFLLGTVVSVPMGASISTGFGDGGTLFALCVTGIMLLGLTMLILGTAGEDQVVASVIRWAVPNGVAMALLIAGSFLDGSARTTLWVAAIVVVILAMVAAGRGDWIVRMGHFAERHALIVIIALGEVIVAIGLPVVRQLEAGESLSMRTTAALLASGTLASLMWWIYFDRPARGMEYAGKQLEIPRERTRFVRDVYTWAHAPIVAGIILIAAGVEEIALHPDVSVPLHFRMMLILGTAGIVGGITAGIWRSFGVVPRERLVASLVLSAVLAGAGSLSGLTLLIIVDVGILATLAIEHRRIEAMS